LPLFLSGYSQLLDFEHYFECINTTDVLRSQGSDSLYEAVCQLETMYAFPIFVFTLLRSRFLLLVILVLLAFLILIVVLFLLVRSFVVISFSLFKYFVLNFQIWSIILSESMPLIFLSLKETTTSDKAMDWSIILPGAMKNQYCCEQKSGVSHD
jgi:hypothetical protein